MWFLHPKTSLNIQALLFICREHIITLYCFTPCLFLRCYSGSDSYFDSGEAAFPADPHSARSSEKTLLWGHWVPGATLCCCYIISPAPWMKPAPQSATRQSKHILRGKQQQQTNKQQPNKHGEDHFPASFGAEAWKRERWRQDHYTSGSREFAHFLLLCLLLWYFVSCKRLSIAGAAYNPFCTG